MFVPPQSIKERERFINRMILSSDLASNVNKLLVEWIVGVHSEIFSKKFFKKRILFEIINVFYGMSGSPGSGSQGTSSCKVLMISG